MSGSVDAASGRAPGSVVLALVVSMAAMGVVFFPEIKAAIEVWNASTAYSHCYLVLPMTLYLLWERRAVFRLADIRPEPVAVLGAIPIAFVWLVAERLGIMEGRQLAAIAGVELLILTVIGWRLYWTISGPLLFLFFLVPFGAFLTPALQRFTAAFSIIGLNLLGIPNYSDKFTIETPAGVFFVAEACAGLRFLIAAIAFGVFYALLNYTSPVRRLAFIAASIVVPIVANGFRALGIVVLGQMLGSAEAAAADHLVYGWVFFSIVMLLLIAAGQLFREDTAEPAPRPVQLSGSSHPISPVWYAAMTVLLLGVGPAVAATIDAKSVPPHVVNAPEFVVPAGCEQTGLRGPATRRLITISCGDADFEISVDVFAARSTSSAIVAERRRVTQEVGAEDVSVVPVSLEAGLGRWTIVQTTDPNRASAYASWVDGLPVESGFAGRIAQARGSLVGADHAPALITITTPEPAHSPPAQRKAKLDRLTALLQAQTGLDARMAKFTEIVTR